MWKGEENVGKEAEREECMLSGNVSKEENKEKRVEE